MSQLGWGLKPPSGDPVPQCQSHSGLETTPGLCPSQPQVYVWLVLGLARSSTAASVYLPVQWMFGPCGRCSLEF